MKLLMNLFVMSLAIPLLLGIGCAHGKKEESKPKANLSMPKEDIPTLSETTLKVIKEHQKKNANFKKWSEAFLLTQLNYHKAINVLGTKMASCSNSPAPPTNWKPALREWIEKKGDKKTYCKKIRTAIAGVWIKNLRMCQGPAIMQMLYAEMEFYPFVESAPKYFGEIKTSDEKEKEEIGKIISAYQKYLKAKPTPMYGLLAPSPNSKIKEVALEELKDEVKFLESHLYFRGTVNIARSLEIHETICPKISANSH